MIRRVSAEFGLTADKGYTVSDPNLAHLYELYNQPGSAIALYKQLGFCYITSSMGNIGRVNCEVAMLKTL